MDPVGFAALDLTASVTPQSEVPSDEKFHFRGNFRKWPWTLKAYYNPANFYDFFGPTEESRKGYGLVGEYTGIFINDRPRSLDYGVSLSGFGGLDTLPEYQEIEATIDELFRPQREARVQSRAQDHRRAATREGPPVGALPQRQVRRVGELPARRGHIDFGIPLPIKYSSLWLRSSAGYSWGDPENTLSNFYFGAFGNNWVDYQEVRRYHDYYSFPGIEINELGANNFGKLLLEWELPAIAIQTRRDPRPLFHLGESGTIRQRHCHQPRRQ